MCFISGNELDKNSIFLNKKLLMDKYNGNHSIGTESKAITL